MSKYILKTLGCKANFYDSQALEKSLQESGWLPQLEKGSPTELCIVNSCSVTDEADRQTRRTAARLAKENPNAVVVVTGCGAEVDPENLAAQKGVHFVVGNQNKTEFTNLVLEKIGQISHPKAVSIDSHILSTDGHSQNQKLLGTVSSYQQLLSRHPLDREWPALSDSFRTPPTQLAGHTDKTRAFLKIQEGCDAFCTYCIIPYGRGPARSLKPEPLIEQVLNLQGGGAREIILTGTNIGDYGRDWAGSPQLEVLVEKILSESTVERLRLSSLDPSEISPRLLQLMKENPRFCPHFHVSLQSPHPRILKLMKRKYSYAEVEGCLVSLSKLNTPSGLPVFVGMDVITGFPGESDEEFEWTFSKLAELPWHRLHVFPYSERKGTPATRLPASVPQAKRLERARRLNALSLERLRQFYTQVLAQSRQDQTLISDVLMERPDSKGWTSGYSPNYLRLLVQESLPARRNQTVSIQPLDVMVDPGSCDVALIGRIV